MPMYYPDLKSVQTTAQQMSEQPDPEKKYKGIIPRRRRSYPGPVVSSVATSVRCGRTTLPPSRWRRLSRRRTTTRNSVPLLPGATVL